MRGPHAMGLPRVRFLPVLWRGERGMVRMSPPPRASARARARGLSCRRHGHRGVGRSRRTTRPRPGGGQGGRTAAKSAARARRGAASFTTILRSFYSIFMTGLAPCGILARVSLGPSPTIGRVLALARATIARPHCNEEVSSWRDNDARRALDAPESACNARPPVPAPVPVSRPPGVPRPLPLRLGTGRRRRQAAQHRPHRRHLVSPSAARAAAARRRAATPCGVSASP